MKRRGRGTARCRAFSISNHDGAWLLTVNQRALASDAIPRNRLSHSIAQRMEAVLGYRHAPTFRGVCSRRGAITYVEPRFTAFHDSPPRNAHVQRLASTKANLVTKRSRKTTTARRAVVASACIQYAGEPGCSRECQVAVLRFLQNGDIISSVRILTCTTEHCLLLALNGGDRVAIKSGFATGYLGEGPTCFSYTLNVLDQFGINIDECEISPLQLARIDASALTARDLLIIEKTKPIRPDRWQFYIHERHCDSNSWDSFPRIIPFAIVDQRIADLAIAFWNAPGENLLIAYRRLEDIVRKRTKSTDYGAKLFSQAFNAQSPALKWRDAEVSEQAGRAQLFTGTFTAFRNRRAHRELDDFPDTQLTEFLLVNQLFRLEREAVNVETKNVVVDLVKSASELEPEMAEK